MGQSQSQSQTRTTPTHPQTVFKASYAPTGRAKCGKCKEFIKEGSLRLSREMPSANAFDSDCGTITKHYHGRTECGMAVVRAMKCASPAVHEVTASPVPEPSLLIDESVSEGDQQRVTRTFASAAKDFTAKCKKTPNNR